MREPKESLRLDVRLDPENPVHCKVREKFSRASLRHGELGRIVAELFARNFDLDADIRPQVLEFLYGAKAAHTSSQGTHTMHTAQGTHTTQDTHTAQAALEKTDADASSQPQAAEVQTPANSVEKVADPEATKTGPHRSTMGRFTRGR